MKNFYITYYSQKDKKTITRGGEHDDKSRFGENKKTVSSTLNFLVLQ